MGTAARVARRVRLAAKYYSHPARGVSRLSNAFASTLTQARLVSPKRKKVENAQTWGTVGFVREAS